MHGNKKFPIYPKYISKNISMHEKHNITYILIHPYDSHSYKRYAYKYTHPSNIKDITEYKKYILLKCIEIFLI